MSAADLYIEAADILNRASNKEATLKRLVLQSHYKNLKVLYALACKAVQKRSTLDSFIAKIGADQTQLYHENYFLALCLAYDIFYGEGVGSAACDQSWDEFISCCKMGKLGPIGSEITEFINNEVALVRGGPPKYVRVNTLKISRAELKRKIVENEFFYARNTFSPKRDEYNQFLDVVENQMGPEEFTNDMHMRSLFVFAANTDLHECDFFMASEGIVQDKASALVAPVLAPPINATVVDCCAAPGNKTSHLAALLQNSG